jgi:RHS repeat-associated protein
VWTGEYLPFGGAFMSEGEADRYRFTQHELDTQTGLLYAKARYYHPGIGRFITIDPVGGSVGRSQSWNGYAYASNNPINRFDPDGSADVKSEVASGLFGFLPIAGEIQDFTIAVTGFDPITAEQQSTSTRVLSGVALFVPFVGGKALGKGIDALRGADKAADTGKTFHTYTKTQPETGQVYTGRTSGTGTPEQNVARRDAGHHKNEEGYGPAVLDQSSTDPAAIRGREQQLIEVYGGAQSQGGTSGNAINGISANNPRGPDYSAAAQREFGGGSQ